MFVDNSILLLRAISECLVRSVFRTHEKLICLQMVIVVIDNKL